jgi:hypothetical protein
MENKNFSYAIRMIIFLILICVLPISIAKIIKSFTKKDSNQITKNELNSEIKKYIENNAESVLEILLNKYFSLKKEEKSNFEINNAIWLFEKDLFNENFKNTNPCNSSHFALNKIFIIKMS